MGTQYHEEIASIELGKEVKINTIKNKSITPYIQELEMNLEAIEKGGYDHFMLKEIYEQPQSIKNSMLGRLKMKSGKITLSGMFL